MARVYSAVAPLRELRAALSELRLHDLAAGSDGRNRCLLSAFRARSSRNAPSNSKFIFGPSTWIRGLIKPPPDHAIAYIDWCQQEFGIAAALSGDPAMLAAYLSGDPYLAFAKQAGAIPPDGTKATHGPTRELYKTASLGVLYGMGERGLALRLVEPPIVAAHLLAAHRQVYRRFWQWSDAAIDYAVLTGSLSTVFGWTIHVKAGFNARSLRNFPMQANGAEMLRLACCLATERGVEVCAPVHDALLICAHLDRIDDAAAVARAAMAEASRIVLDGFELRTDANVVRWPDRYMDPRGARMWEVVNKLIAATDRKQGIAA
jgi:DNA polymerase I-like protein with 3'-5' exonuclease and polymerase domains